MALRPLVRFEQVSQRFRSAVVLDQCDWQWSQGENIAISGANGSGKSAIARLISGTEKPQSGSIIRNPSNARIIYLSFDAQRKHIARDRKLDDSEFRADARDPGTTVHEFILKGQGGARLHETLIKQLRIGHILDSGIRFISTGETRRMLLAKALISEPAGIIIDEPTDGLDRQSRNEINRVINQLLQSPVAVMVLCADEANIPKSISKRHYLFDAALHTQPQEILAKPEHIASPTIPSARGSAEAFSNKTLIDLKHVDVSFSGKRILSDITWRMQSGQHCHISGPNGSGKTTLLELLCGANHSAYGQQVEIFGRRRGSGESVWEIKKLFGIVNTRMQWEYSGRLTCNEVVASGLFDSIGLYEQCSHQQLKTVEQWLHLCDLWQFRDKPFETLSFGAQRLALIARAMVKSPPVLIVDEPFIGLDSVHKSLVIKLIDTIADAGATAVLFVSHDAKDEPECINQWLDLVPAEMGYTARIRQ